VGRAKFNPQGWIYPPAIKLSPGGEDPLFSPSFFLKKKWVNPWGWTIGCTFILGVKVRPWGPSSPLGPNFMLIKNRPQKWPPGVDVMITIFGDFSQFSATKLAFFLNTNVMIIFFQNLALFWVKIANFFAEFFVENILKNHNIGPRTGRTWTRPAGATSGALVIRKLTSQIFAITLYVHTYV
jgi:hypothetical protein